MTDPRQNDPRYEDPLPGGSDPRANRGNAAIWGWVAGIAVVILIAFILAAGWNNNVRTATRIPRAAGVATPTTHTVPPPVTTGSGGSAPAGH